MKRCAVKPYEGMQNYIFVSYCHKDRAYVFPIIEQMAREGFRIWYDEGIDPGSEWPEIIAEHLNNANSCIAFISKNSLDSHNCRREINFALLKKVPFLSIILEPVQMSLGMEMQLSSSQSIFKYSLSEHEFFNKIYDAVFLKKSLGEPNISIKVSRYDSHISDSDPELFSENENNSFSDRWFIKGELRTPSAKYVNASPEIVSEAGDNAAGNIRGEAPVSSSVPGPGPAYPVDVSGAKLAEVPENEEGAFPDQPEDTPLPEEVPVTSGIYLLHRNTNRRFILKPGMNSVGRSSSKSDYVIPENEGLSRCHFIVTLEDRDCYLVDNYSLNKTLFNGSILVPDSRTILHNGDIIEAAGEEFVFISEEE